MLNAAIKDCPVFGGKVKSFDAAKVSGMKGVKKVVQVDDKAVAVVADTWWQAKTALEALPIEWDKGENAKVSSESIAKWLEEGLTAETKFVGNKAGDAAGRDRRRGQEGRGGLRLSVPEPRLPGADERDRALHARQVRGLDQHAERRGRLCRGDRRVGTARRQVRGSPADARHRLRPAHAQRIRDGSRADRQADARHADQAAQVPRRGHDQRRLSSGHAVQADRRARQGQQPRRHAHAHLRPVDPGLRASGGDAGRRRSGHVPGPQSRRRRGRVRLRHPEPADRPRHAQPARPAVVLARREQQPERHLSRMLHRRDWRTRRVRIRSRSGAR